MNKKTLSPVISSLILSAAVLTIGGGVWSYSMGAASYTATDYTSTTTEMVHTIIERLNIEHVDYDITTEDVTVWVYNYGSIHIEVDVTVTIDGTDYPSTVTTGIAPKTMEDIVVEVNLLLDSDEMVSVKAETERENVDYEIYHVP
jgi:archaellum component FlaF (FlaF/FlaG flagellin family)